jgi:CRISPR-associated protein Csb2
VAHTATRKVPTISADRSKTDEKSGSPVPPRTAVRPARYTRVAADTGHAPWPDVLLVPLDRAIVECDRVRLAVAAHRALIRVIGEGAPSVLTGAYPEGASRPPNRVALQILAAEHPIDLPNDAPAALAVMLPRDVAAGDLAAVLGAVRGLRSLRAPYRQSVAVTGHAELRAGATFWPESPAGTVRLWRTSPAAVPDTRGSGQDWTFAHAALLGLGFVWQASPHLPRVPGRGSDRYRGMVAAVNDAGAAAITVEPLRTSAVSDYVHRVHPDAVVRPYRATLTLGDLGGPRLLQAIGQSRHLGGGLLVPVDLPEGSTMPGPPR